MLYPSMILLSLASLAAVVALYYSNGLDSRYSQKPIGEGSMTDDLVPFSTRAFWMRRANAVLEELSSSPCPFSPFGSVIVNHTGGDSVPGELVCIGFNYVFEAGNPTGHGIVSGARHDAADAGEQAKLRPSATAPRF
jgi:hypothetical protein